MTNVSYFLARLSICAGITLSSALAQISLDVPDHPFQAVHLMNFKSADAEKTILAALVDYNEAIAKNCPKCIYHLMKGTDNSSGSHNYLWTSSWPGREVYIKVHQSPEYLAAEKRHPEIQSLVAKETYDRYVELTPTK